MTIVPTIIPKQKKTMRPTMPPRRTSFSVIILFISVTLLGLLLLPKLSLKLVPTKSLPSISIDYWMHEASARVVEQEITSKLEAVVNRLSGVKNIRSYSYKGAGSLSVEIDKHADLELVRFEVSSTVRQLWSTLPVKVPYPSIRLSTPSQPDRSPMLTYMLVSPMGSNQIYQWAEEKIKQQLAPIKGISSIRISGYQPSEWQLTYDVDQLRRWGITPDDVTNAIRQQYKGESLGLVLTDSGQFIRLQLSPSVTNGFDPTRIDVKTIEGHCFTLDKIVTIEHREQQSEQQFRINGLNTLTLSIIPDVHANQVELSNIVQSKVQQIQQTLPDSFKIQKTYDASIFLKKELAGIFLRSGLTLFILFLFITLITRDWKYITLTLTSLTINLLLSVIFYYLFKLEIQLYSLAGITLSLSLVIDNTIVMVEHLRHKNNMKVILPIIAATLTSIASLVAIFAFDERTRLNLQDFSLVIIINLSVSVVVSLFFVPALFDKIALSNHQRPNFSPPRRIAVKVNKGYRAVIHWLIRRKGWCILFFILLFGTPVFMLPTKIDNDTSAAKVYNSTIGSKFYQEKLKKYVEVCLGGTWRLFAQEVPNGNFDYSGDETVITVNLSMPAGATFPQMDHVVRKVEQQVSRFQGVRQFETQIEGAQLARIRIYFNRQGLLSGLPYSIQNQLFSKISEYDGVSCSIVGKGHGFSNQIYDMAGEYQIECLGYNYDELSYWTNRLSEMLLHNKRVNGITIDSKFSYTKPDYREFIFRINPLDMGMHNVSNTQLFRSMNERYNRGKHITDFMNNNNKETITLRATHARNDDLWWLNNHYNPALNNRLRTLANVDFRYAPQDIAKENQQYKLCLQYSFVGMRPQGEKVLRQTVDAFNRQLPLGFSAKAITYQWWDHEGARSKYLILLIIVIVIYVICSILFNSLLQPLIIIFIIPISFIGLFLSFYLFDLNFDQGGFAAFILLCGITVNSAIYVVNEFNAQSPQCVNANRSFQKAINSKILSIFLTVASTILGFIPFIVATEPMPFWFSLAIGTIGGLAFSMLGLLIYLPLMLVSKKKTPLFLLTKSKP